VIALAGVLAGCATTPAARPPDAAANAAGASNRGPDTPTSEFAEQARRDVEQLRRLQEPFGDRRASAEPAHDAPPEIQWILPRTDSPAAEADRAKAGPRGEHGQTALHSDGPPGPSTTEFPLPMPTELPGGGVVADPNPHDPSDLPDTLDSPDPPDTGAAPETLRRLIVELSAELYRRGAYSDMPMRELLLIAATTMVTPDRALIPEALPGLTQREREIVGLMQDFFRRLGQELDATGDPEVVVTAIIELAAALQKQSSLVLPTVSLCTRVGGFGDYDEFPRTEQGRYTFLAHSGQQAVVYVEVDDFVSELDAKGRWVTELSQQLVVFSDRDGIPVWREDWQLGTDISKNRREDFFIVQIITLPERLSVGLYQLKIHVRDKRSRAEAEVTIEFEMVADPRMVGGVQ